MTDHDLHAGDRVEYRNPQWVGLIEGEGTVLPAEVAAAGAADKPDDWPIKVAVLWDDEVGLTWEYPDHLARVTAVREARYACWLIGQDGIAHLQAVHPDHQAVWEWLVKIGVTQWPRAWVSEVWAETNLPLHTGDPAEFGPNHRWDLEREPEP